MKKIIQAYHEDPSGCYLEVIACLNHIVYLLYKEFANHNPAVCQITPVGEIEKKMISYIYHHFGDRVRLQDIADAGCVNTHTCCDIFRHYLHTTPIRFLNQFRLEMASRLLVTTDTTIEHISFSCGFDSSAYFIKMFRETYHMTPRVYRTENR